MISAPGIKKAFSTKFQERPGGANVGLVFGVPETPAELTGDDPLYKQAIGFADPFGEYRIEEFCGPDTVEFEEDYVIPLTIQVVARTRDTGFFEVETRLAELVYQATRVLQDPTLGIEDARIGRLWVTLGATDKNSGWVSVGNTKLAATRQNMELHCEAHIQGEAHP